MIHSLNVAQTGLAASKASVENVMNNVANANTEGYKKRVVETSELNHADSRLWGRGVSIDDTVRITSQYLYDNIVKENSKENYYTEQSTMLSNIESIFKETDSSGFSADLDRYYQTIESARANPTNEVYKNELRLNGQMIVDDIQRLYTEIEAQEDLAKNALEQDVEEINDILKDIATVNDKINEQGYASNDLLDKRDLLEKKLSSYVDISVNRDYEFYELKIGSEVAVRNDSPRTLTIGEVYTPQKDRYIKDDGITSSILDGVTFDNEDVIVFELDNSNSVSVQFGESMSFDLDGDGTTDSVTVDETNYVRALAHKINSDYNLASKVKAFNGNYSLDENGQKVTDDSSDSFLLIESKNPGEDGKFDSRVSFIESAYSNATYVYTPAGQATDKLSVTSLSSDDGSSIEHTFTLASTSTGTEVWDIEFTDTYGYYAASPTFEPDTIIYDEENKTISLPAGVDSFTVTYNTNELADADTNQVYGIKITDATATPTELESEVTIVDTDIGTVKSIYKNEEQSNIATNTITVNLFDEEVVVSSGKVKAILDNLTTLSGNNKFTSYKEELDNFVKTFTDITSSYFKNDDGSYIYGEIAADESSEIPNDINLFSGSNAKTFTFNSLVIGDLEQKDFDYLATIQWKDDISFTGFGQGTSVVASDNATSSLSEFYQDLRVGISRDKENSDFLVDTQKAINESLNSSYDQMTKVDNDEEMVNLIKFQAAYTASAKIITVVDEMLNTLLNMR